jgi:uncharacterized phage protein (TIGR01671 family)
MREILFRGKRSKDGEWVQGWFVGKTRNEPYKLPRKKYTIIDENLIAHYIVPSTICQFTGLTDKNGTKIFEGDIVKTDEYWCEIGVVKYGEGTFDSGIYRYTGFYYEDKDGYIDHHSLYQAKDEEDVKFVVIGNIFDNPELLE